MTAWRAWHTHQHKIRLQAVSKHGLLEQSGAVADTDGAEGEHIRLHAKAGGVYAGRGP